MVNVLPAGIPSPRGMTFEGASAALLGDLLRVRSVEDSYRAQDWQTDNQKQGNRLNQFYQACELVGSPTASNSNAFVVVPDPGSPSVGICGID